MNIVDVSYLTGGSDEEKTNGKGAEKEGRLLGNWSLYGLFISSLTNDIIRSDVFPTPPSIFRNS